VPTDTGYRDGLMWTGELVLDLRNGQDWSAADAELSLRRDTVLLRHEGRNLAVLDRDLFRDWLIQTEPEPLMVDDVVWSVQVGITFMAAGKVAFRVSPESLSTLVSVI
jgi:hypothetical protein